MRRPTTAVCAASRPLAGHAAPSARHAGSMIAATRPKRSARNVIGPAWGMPSLAPMNPVDHNNTNPAGAAATSTLRGGASTCAEIIAARPSPASLSSPPRAGESREGARCCRTRNGQIPSTAGPPLASPRKRGEARHLRALPSLQPNIVPLRLRHNPDVPHGSDDAGATSPYNPPPMRRIALIVVALLLVVALGGYLVWWWTMAGAARQAVL